MKKILIPLADGFEEIEAVSIIDVLRRAGLDVLVTSINSDLKVKGSHDIIVQADDILSHVDPDKFDMIVLPGGIPGATNLNAHTSLRSYIVDFKQKGKWLGAICAAPLVLGELNLLQGEYATCYPGFEQQLTGATVRSRSVEISNKIITGKGAGVAIQFALKIVEVLIGTNEAKELGEKMMLPTPD